MTPDIELSEFISRREQGEFLIFIDVREEWEHEETNIGAQLLPLNQIPFRLQDLPFGKNDEVILHCGGGRRSNLAKILLHQHGYTNVRSLVGGMNAFLDLQNS